LTLSLGDAWTKPLRFDGAALHITVFERSRIIYTRAGQRSISCNDTKKII